jgi:hypothetical protein
VQFGNLTTGPQLLYANFHFPKINNFGTMPNLLRKMIAGVNGVNINSLKTSTIF